MNESHCCFPKVQYHMLVGTLLVCHASEESRTRNVISPHLLYLLKNQIKVPMNFREIQVWKIKVVGRKQIEPAMRQKRSTA